MCYVMFKGIITASECRDWSKPRNISARDDATHLCDLVESSEEVVQGHDQVGGAQLFRERGEVHDVGIENAERRHNFIIAVAGSDQWRNYIFLAAGVRNNNGRP